MTTTTSSSNEKGRLLHLYRFILRRYLGVAILYFLLQLLFFPLQYVLTAANTLQKIARGGTNAEFTAFVGSGQIYNIVSQPVMWAMAVGAALFPLLQMSYLHQKKSVDLYHALPIRREQLLLVNFAASVTLVFSPLLVNFLLVLIAGLSFGLSCFSLAGLFYELIIMSASVLGVLSVCYFTAMLAGTVFEHLLYTGGLLAGLPLTLYAAYYQMLLLLYGFRDIRGLHRGTVLLSPATLGLYSALFPDNRLSSRPLLSGSERILLAAALIWILLAAILLFLSTRLYRRRKSELAGQSGAHNGLALFLKMLGALLGGICLSMLLCSVSNLESLFISIPSALAGGTITVCLIECILARGFKTLKKSLPLMAAGALLPALFVLIIGTGGLGYESRIPNLSNIKSITLTDYRDRYGFARYDLSQMRADFAASDAASLRQRSLCYRQELIFQQPESIRQIRQLHEAVLEQREKEDTGERASLSLCYRLKNGRTLTRCYDSLPETAALLCDQLNALEETKQQMHPLFTLGPADIREITLMNRLMAGITPVSLSQSDTERLMQALRDDMLEEPCEEMVNPEVIGYIVLTPQYNSRAWTRENLRRADFILPAGETGFSDCYVALTPRYTRTLSLLGQLGYGSFTEIDFSCFESAYLRLESFYGSSLLLSGPEDFEQATYRERNYDVLFYRSSYDTEIKNPADIRTLAEKIRYNPAQSALLLPYTPEEQELFEQWNAPVSLHLMLVSKNGDNLMTEFYIRPCDVPQSILAQLRERFSHIWSEELFDFMLEKFQDKNLPLRSSSSVQAMAAEEPYIRVRF